jgi:hypothetical protein
MPTTLAKLSWPLLNGPIKLKYTVIKLDRKRHWVELKCDNISINESNLIIVDQWVTKNNIGKRMAFNQWRLKSAAAVTWFILKWG